MSQELPILKKGSFYLIKDGSADLILEDRTKRGLTVREQTLDENHKVLADKGMIHDMDGIGHWVPIRWYFPKKDHSFEAVLENAERMEKKYTELRELTCPDDLE
ncbi:hypothetical protein [Candidatus Nitrosotenuis cloacae]|uniref:Uncharacterized protein n=1 Tax=Candidatus Nitrosotenuis cloacae TaxID=1603555 RepID=A0A3G1B0K2_9ARCH|nr:hypothetical protein [Candidatus Nitrosotenuis cloacae]AJZ75642.1 hypothetical protein SU86_003840 [Candidatus Nitrosotenuis cloacae]